MMDRYERLLAEYEATGEEAARHAATAELEAQLVDAPDSPRLQYAYGYLQECQARRLLKEAAAVYERVIDLDPAWEKPRHQLIWVRGALFETAELIDVYRQRLDAAPDDPKEYRCLAAAYLAGNEHAHAEAVVGAGLAIAPDDPALLTQLGDIYAATDRPDEALAHLHHALEIDPDLVDARYSIAFLLERDDRPADAIAEWQRIVDWLEAHGYSIQSEWPRREIDKLQRRLDNCA